MKTEVKRKARQKKKQGKKKKKDRKGKIERIIEPHTVKLKVNE